MSARDDASNLDPAVGVTLMNTYHEDTEREARDEEFQAVLEFYAWRQYVARKEEQRQKAEAAKMKAKPTEVT